MQVQINLTVAGCPLRAEITNRVTTAVRRSRASTQVDIGFSVMTDEERARVREIVQGDPAATAGSQPAHGHAQGRAIPFADPANRTRVLLVASGKGGVGKSSVTTNLVDRPRPAGQVGRGDRRRRVGLLDPADARRRPPSRW